MITKLLFIGIRVREWRSGKIRNFSICKNNIFCIFVKTNLIFFLSHFLKIFHSVFKFSILFKKKLFLNIFLASKIIHIFQVFQNLWYLKGSKFLIKFWILFYFLKRCSHVEVLFSHNRKKKILWQIKFWKNIFFAKKLLSCEKAHYNLSNVLFTKEKLFLRKKKVFVKNPKFYQSKNLFVAGKLFLKG